MEREGAVSFIDRYRVAVAFSFVNVNIPTQISLSTISKFPVPDGNLAASFFQKYSTPFAHRTYSLASDCCNHLTAIEF
jgi:hypothetical protein